MSQETVTLTVSKAFYDDMVKTAQRQLPGDGFEEGYDPDFNAQDWSGGNFDDAYQLGSEHGSIESNRAFLCAAGVEF